MRPVSYASHPRAVALCEAVPEMRERYRGLVELYDEDLDCHALYSELAALVSELLLESLMSARALDRCFTAVETLAEEGGEDSAQLVGFSFLDSLSPADLESAMPMLGPRTLGILSDLEEDLI